MSLLVLVGHWWGTDAGEALVDACMECLSPPVDGSKVKKGILSYPCYP